MIDGSEKRHRQLAFELQNSHVCEKRSNFLKKKKNKACEILKYMYQVLMQMILLWACVKKCVI